MADRTTRPGQRPMVEAHHSARSPSTGTAQDPNALGVCREGVTEAGGKLQKPGVLRHAGGWITVLDRPVLERPGRECYSVIKKEGDRLLPHPPVADAR